MVYHVEQLLNYLKIADSETSIIQIVFNGVLCEVNANTVMFLIFAIHESGTRKAMSWVSRISARDLQFIYTIDQI